MQQQEKSGCQPSCDLPVCKASMALQLHEDVREALASIAGM